MFGYHGIAAGAFEKYISKIIFMFYFSSASASGVERIKFSKSISFYRGRSSLGQANYELTSIPRP